MRYLALFLLAISGIAFAQSGDNKDASVVDDLQKMTSNKHPVDDLPKEKLTDRALESLLDGMFVLSPEEKRKILDEKRRHTSVKYMNADPKEIHAFIDVSTRPESPLPELYLTPYHVSMITVVDSTGEPWPIVDASERHDNFHIDLVEKHSYKNLLKGTADFGVGNTNLSLVLADLSTVVSVKLVASEDKYHPAPVLQIDKPGPNAKVLPVFTAQPLQDADLMRRLIVADLPEGFLKMRSDDPNVDAWLFENSLYVRSVYQPSNPHPRAYHYGPNGYGAYKMAYVPVIVMVNSTGQEKRIRISEGESK